MHQVSPSLGFAQRFNNPGELLHSVMSITGELSDFNRSVVRTVLASKAIEIVEVESDDLIESHQFYLRTDWLGQWLNQVGFTRVNPNTFVLFDDGNAPVAFITVTSNHNQNVYFNITAERSLVSDLVGLAKKQISSNPVDADLSDYIMITGIGGDRSPFGNGEDRLKYERRKLRNTRVNHDEFYPFIEGGISSFIKDFIEAPDAVSIFIGAPGTGKTSGIMNNIEALGVMPIYATGSDIVLNPLFVKKMFELGDQFLDEFQETEAKKENRNLFQESDWVNSLRTDISKDKDAKDKKKFFPMLIVEDCDALLAPKNRNPLMSTLLNQTDGVESREGRKVMFTTNLKDHTEIDEALCRPGRCFDVQNFRSLTVEEAIIARRVAGLPDFDKTPTRSMTLAEALRPVRRSLSFQNGTIGFNAIK